MQNYIESASDLLLQTSPIILGTRPHPLKKKFWILTHIYIYIKINLVAINGVSFIRWSVIIKLSLNYCKFIRRRVLLYNWIGESLLILSLRVCICSHHFLHTEKRPHTTIQNQARIIRCSTRPTLSNHFNLPIHRLE